MKANVSIEFTDEELKDFGWGLVTRGLAHIGNSIDKMPSDPQFVGMLQGMLNQFLNMGKPHGARGAPPHAYAGPPPWGPYAVPPGAGFVPGYGPQPPPQARVVPINPEIVHEKCFAIDETRQLEAGWGCCQCATYNGLARDACRHCKHARCHHGPIITPPPQNQG